MKQGWGLLGLSKTDMTLTRHENGFMSKFVDTINYLGWHEHII